MWSQILPRLEARFPRLFGRGVGRFRRDLPAFGVSLTVHLALLLGLGLMVTAAQVDAPSREIAGSSVASTVLPEFDPTEIQDMDQPAAPAVVVALGSTAPEFSAVAKEGVSAPAVAAKSDGAGPAVMIATAGVSRPGEIAMPSAATVNQTVSIRGNAAEHVGGVEGAVDRIAMELLNRLQRNKLLVVWAFDASGSLVVEREKLAKHIEDLYTHIAQLDQDQLAGGDALETMVVAFGESRKAMLKEPTTDRAAIIGAIRAVPIDKSGFESTFTTVGHIVKTWGKPKDHDGKPRQTVVIVVTDEVGDDEANLEGAIATATAAKVPIYVLGSPALFGQVEGRMNYTDPETKKTSYNIAVRQGPESVALETIHLPFWYGGDRYENLDAGFGPYALSRLAGATNGIYFITRIGTARLSFSPDAMREYRPDLPSAEQYARNVQRDPIQGAVTQAALITQQNLPGQPGLTFPAADTPEFKDAMTQNQETVARIAYTVEQALDPINNVVKLRDREPSRRWQAHYDLIRGRLLAMDVRCLEYNYACAKMKRDAPRFKDPKSNAWRLAPTDELLAPPKYVKQAKEATALLKKVVEDYPDTPWALLAKRELKDPLGFKWVEATVPPPPKRNEAAEAAAKKKKAEPKPAAMPQPEIKL